MGSESLRIVSRGSFQGVRVLENRFKGSSKGAAMLVLEGTEIFESRPRDFKLFRCDIKDSDPLNAISRSTGVSSRTLTP
jgi:hypothetical protein